MMTKNRAIEVREASAIVGKQWYDAMIEECEAIISEAVETSRWALVEGYHALGKRILEEKNKFTKEGIDDNEIVSRVSQSLGKSTRTIYRAVQFAGMFQNPEQVPGGKGITWHKVCNTVLVGKELTKDCKHVNTKTIKVCKDCGHHLK